LVLAFCACGAGAEALQAREAAAEVRRLYAKIQEELAQAEVLSQLACFTGTKVQILTQKARG
jgi:ABC-type proline/glycine betaine transport system substrate-binding protein